MDSAPPRGAERFESGPPARPVRLDQLPNVGVGFTDGTPVTSVVAALVGGGPEAISEQRLIPESSRNLVGDSKSIPHVLVVHSGDRNSNVYPSASQYRVQLNDKYVDVESLELNCALIPLSAYNISGSNNAVSFEEVPGTTINATIPAGNYPDATALAFALETTLNAATTMGVTYNATVDPVTGKVTVTSDGASGAIFTLMFFGTPVVEGIGPTQYQREKPAYPPNSVGPALGFAPVDYSSALTYTAPYVPNLDGEPVVYVHVEEAEMLESNNPNIKDCLALIALAGGLDSRGYERFAASEWCRFIRYYSPLRGKLANLTISLRTASGALFDFNGRDHVLTFSIVTRNRGD
jgi:hypothetical protein